MAMQRKRTALFWIGGFFAVMLLLTLYTQTFSAWLLPQVTTGSAESARLAYHFAWTGKAEPLSAQYLLAEPGLRVAEVYVQAGDVVEEGTPLFRYDTAELAEFLREKQAAQRKLELQQRQLDLPLEVDTEGAAERQRDIALEEAWQQVVRARRAESLAEETLRAVQEKYRGIYLDWKKDEDPEEAKFLYPPAFGEEPETTAARQEIAAARSAAVAARETTADAEGALERSLDALPEQSAAAARERESAEIQAKLPADDLAAARRETARLRELLAAEGQVTASEAGTLTSINVGPGERTGDSPAAWYMRSDAGVCVRLELSAAELAEFTEETVLSATVQRGRNRRSFSAEVESIERTAGRLTVRLPESGEFVLGEAVELGLEGESQIVYQSCVPLQAMRRDAGGDFLLVLESQDTVWGRNYTVARRPVTVLERDSTYAALSEGGLSGGEFIVFSSTRPILPGDRVKRGNL